jgi:hypothetical protein
MSLRREGFFRELKHGSPAGLSLKETAGMMGADQRSACASYLKAGTILATTGQSVDDVLTSRKSVAPLDIRTDGVWVWPGDLAYYVEVHGVALTDEFLRHMRERRWHCEPLSEEELALAEAEYFR